MALPVTRTREIIEGIAAQYGLTYSDIVGHRREGHIVCARHEAIAAVAATYPGASSTTLGRLFNRDHTSILHALGRTKKARDRLNMTLGAAAE